MKHYSRCTTANRSILFLAFACLLTPLLRAQPVPTLTSIVPPSTVSGSAVFTFSQPMDTTATMVMFFDLTSPGPLSSSDSWSAGYTVLSCAPQTSWPAGHVIAWYAAGTSAEGVGMDEAAGTFTIGGGGTGCDPSAPLLSLTVAKGFTYDQSSANPPTLDPVAPYCFVGCVSIPCPRDATNVTLRPPGGIAANMPLTTIPGHLTLTDCRSTSTLLDAAYPTGDYLFNIQAVSSNQQVTVNFSGSLTQPPAPRVFNYAAAQAVNPGQPFTLTWDAWPSPPASSCVYVELDYGGVAFATPAPTVPGALPGTATSVVIPAMTLQTNRQYSGLLTFYHYLWVTNGTAYGTLTYRATTTQFTLSTAAYRPAISSPGWASASTFRFDVACPVGQALTALWSTNPASDNWLPLLSTNSTTEQVRFTDPGAGTRSRLFYRVRTGL